MLSNDIERNLQSDETTTTQSSSTPSTVVIIDETTSSRRETVNLTSTNNSTPPTETALEPSSVSTDYNVPNNVPVTDMSFETSNVPPPSYEAVTRLPTYEEVQREKIVLGEPLPSVDTSIPMARPSNNIRTPVNQQVSVVTVTDSEPDDSLLGTDFMFFSAFLIAFVLNWVGFLLLMCFWHTVAARYGALSGFGLSLFKWTMFVRNYEYMNDDPKWLWFVMACFGLLICIRSFFQYIHIKRNWRSLSRQNQRRYLFLY